MHAEAREPHAAARGRSADELLVRAVLAQRERDDERRLLAIPRETHEVDALLALERDAPPQPVPHPEAVQRKIAVRLLQMLEASPAEESAATLRSLRLVGALPSDLETRLDWASEELFLVAEGTVAGSDGDVIESLRVDLERLVDTM